MNNITSPELLAQVNPENIQLQRDFVDYLRSVQRSEGTIAGYISDLEIAWVWNLQHNENKLFVNWTKRNVVAFQNWLINENENSPARVRRLKSSLSSLSGFIEAVLDDEFPNFRNIIRKIEDPVNQPVREKTTWTDEDIESLLDKLVEKKKYEQACFFALAAFGGRRKAELCRFKVSDFGDDHLVCDGALYKSDPIKTKGRGGGKMTECYTLAKKFKPYFDLWMKDRERRGIESVWLFPDKTNPEKQMSISRANSFAETYTRLSGKQVYMHSLRHANVTYYLKQGIPESVIQEIYDWTTLQMVKVYSDLGKEDQISMYFANGDIVTQKEKSISDL